MPWWNRPFDLGLGYELHLRGATSVLVSDKLDNDAQYRLVVPEQMVMMRRQPNRIWAVLAHHPRDWLRRRDHLADVIDSRARIQLYGHKHLFKVRQVGTNVVCNAGSTNPERTSDWLPHYNVFTLQVESASGSTMLRVTVHPRRWYTSERCFGPDTDARGRPNRVFILPISAASDAEKVSEQSADNSSPEICEPVMSAGVPSAHGRRYSIVVPNLGNEAEAVIDRWYKREGETVRAYEPLYDIETTKCLLQVNSPADGVLVKILMPDGQMVWEGTELGFIEY